MNKREISAFEDVPTLQNALRPLAGSWSRVMRVARAWPPDSFALTYAILARSEAYRFVASPPEGQVVPFGTPEWCEEMRRVGAAWAEAVGTNQPIPQEVRVAWEHISRARTWPLSQLQRVDTEGDVAAASWSVVEALLSLNAMADMACAGIGIPDGVDAEPVGRFAFVSEANRILGRTGALNLEVPSSRIRVLPCLHTPQLGMTLRSLSLHLSAEELPVPGQWVFPGLDRGGADREMRLLLLPWPLTVADEAFRPCASGSVPVDETTFGFFEFGPKLGFGPVRMRKVMHRARELAGRIDGVVLPEASLDEAELNWVRTVLEEADVHFMIAGVRGKQSNYAHFETFGTRPLEPTVQHKHHRWCLDGSQIGTYGLGFRLDPKRLWWEDIEIKARELHFFALHNWFVVCPLICEDLARIEPVSRLVRSVGPNLVVALLEDGPQLVSRWSSRYATVFGDDPGSSVLTLTSYGMVRRSVPAGLTPKSTVGLWKDRITGTRELNLEPGSVGVMIGVRPKSVKEWTADGRHDDHSTDNLELFEVRQVLLEET